VSVPEGVKECAVIVPFSCPKGSSNKLCTRGKGMTTDWQRTLTF